MKEIEYKVLGVDDLELLVKIRIKDLKMFSNQKITNSTIENIRVFIKKNVKRWMSYIGGLSFKSNYFNSYNLLLWYPSK